MGIGNPLVNYGDRLGPLHEAEQGGASEPENHVEQP
jgi:hypothetical protein